MDTLDGSTWDLIISGTGLTQSLLALALSRSDKKILHLDVNDYYGGQEAAFSLNEAEAWVEAVEHATSNTTFRQASVRKHTPDVDGGPKLSFSRAYSLTLSPQLIYNRSALLPALVSSKVYQQLEFLVVGSWWIYDHERGQSTDGSVKPMPQTGCLRKIPSSREDVANDQSIDLRSKRNVMRFLQLAADADAHPAVIEESGSMLFRDFLSSRFKMAENLHAPFHALTLSPDPSSKTTTAFALPRIHRHLTSIGLFGPGFGAVIPKWGGLAEIAQVACRAGAVGGGVYVLNKGIKRVERKDSVVQDEQQSPLHELRLSEDEVVKTNKSVGSVDDLPSSEGHPKAATGAVARSIDIVSSTLDHVFPPPAEGAAPSAAAVVVFPSGSFESEAPVDETAPIYLVIHSSDTGECPNGQSVIYGQTLASTTSYSLLETAVSTLLHSIGEESAQNVLWSLRYTQALPSPPLKSSDDGILTIPEISPGLVLEDDVLDNVHKAWENIVGNAKGDDFMTFKEREQFDEEEERP